MLRPKSATTSERIMNDAQSPADMSAALMAQGNGLPGLSLGAVADATLALACVAIAFALAYFARRRPDVGARPLLVLLAISVAGIGIVHALGVVVLWLPAHSLQATAKAATALLALATAFAIWRAMPRALALPNPRELETANAALRRDAERRERAGAALSEDMRVLERNRDEQTAALTEANTRLEREIAEHRKTDQALRYNETLLRRLHDGLEEHIAERTAELTKTISELEAFSYSISHDLRAPLRAINGYAAILGAEHGPALDDAGRTLLARIATNAARMAQLIDGLLDFARLARVEFVKGDVDMSELARAAATEVRGGSDADSVELTVAGLPPTRGDAQMLRQVWVNLIANALKFSAPKPKPKIAVGGERRGDEVVYWVRDNGVGFDMAYAEKLFGVFQRLHSAGEFPGVGVGLAIVRRIVLRHGGRIWAESVPGEGSTFYFTVNPAASSTVGTVQP
jgi:signal transduction histidine kinase